MSLERKITRIKNFPLIKRKKVAIYCRVSTTHKDQLHSLSNQIFYYRDLVEQHWDWELVDVYADIRSGKNTSGRPEFQRMLEDCRNHKIEMIITKSISRFGRNTVDTLDVINELRSLLVDVFFENDNLHTKDTQNDFIISILEAYAQAESLARSENIKWGIIKGWENGTSKIYNRKCYGYRQDQDGNLVINDEEAQIVQNIFDLYLNGYSIIAIIRELETLGLKSPTGKDRWSKRAIENMLINEKYIGKVLVGKTFCKEFPNNKRIPNKDQKSISFLAAGNHPAIISEEKFERVQAEKARRSNIDIDGVKRKSTHYSMKKLNNLE